MFAGRKENIASTSLSLRGWDGLFDCSRSPELDHKIGFPSVGANVGRGGPFRELRDFFCSAAAKPYFPPSSYRATAKGVVSSQCPLCGSYTTLSAPAANVGNPPLV